jgi:transcriptional regulator with XRE-family HTH domain
MTSHTPWSTGPAEDDGRLAEIRRDRGLTREQVAERMGVPVERVADIEAGRLDDRGTLAGFAEALGGRLHVAIHFTDGEIASLT